MEPIFKALTQNLFGLAIDKAADKPGELSAPYRSHTLLSTVYLPSLYCTQIALTTLFDFT